MGSPFRLVVLLTAALVCLGAAPGERAAGQQAPAGKPPLEVTQKLPERVEAGAAVPVELTVRNTSPFAVEDVVMKAALPEGYDLRDSSLPGTRANETVSWPLGTLNPGGQSVVRLTLKPAPSAKPLRLRLAVDVAGQVRIASAQTVAVAAPALSLSVIRPEAVSTNVPAALQITVRNTGEVAAREVSLDIVLPAGLTHPSGPELETNLGTIEPGQSRAIPLQLIATRAGRHAARLTVLAGGSAAASEEVILNAEEVRLQVSARGPEALPEQLTGLFELTVRNDAPEAAAQVSLTVELPPELTYARANEPCDYDAQTRTVRWRVGDLRAGEQRTLVWNGVGAKSGEHQWKVRAQAGPRACPESRFTTRVLPARVDAKRAEK